MALPTTVTLNGVNINNGTTYTVLEGVDLGERTKTWSEFQGLNGDVMQYNVTEANLVEMHIPLLVKGTSLSTFNNAINALNVILARSTNTFVFNDGAETLTFTCVHSPRVKYVRDQNSQNGYWAKVDLVLYRNPV